jgi:hypothetical protein
VLDTILSALPYLAGLAVAACHWRWVTRSRAPRRRRTGRVEGVAARAAPHGVDVVDCSATARHLARAFTASSVVRVGGLVIALVGLNSSPAALALVLLGVAVWVIGKQDAAACIVYAINAGAPKIPLIITPAGGEAYRLPRRANLRHQGVTMFVRQAFLYVPGVLLLMLSGIALGYGSTRIIVPIPVPLVDMPTWYSPLPSLPTAALAAGLGWSLLLLDDVLDRRSRRRVLAEASAPPGSGRLESTPAGFVLYLRSFGQETTRIDSNGGRRAYINLDLLPRHSVFFEDVVGPPLWRLGPVHAVADPKRGQPSPTSGAAHRRLTTKADWQEAVRSLMDRSQLVVAVAGTSDGVLWELDTLRANTELARRSIILFAPVLNHWDRVQVLTHLRMTDAASLSLAHLRGLVHTADGPALLVAESDQEVDYLATVQVAMETLGLPAFEPRRRKATAATSDTKLPEWWRDK